MHRCASVGWRLCTPFITGAPLPTRQLSLQGPLLYTSGPTCWTWAGQSDEPPPPGTSQTRGRRPLHHNKPFRVSLNLKKNTVAANTAGIDQLSTQVLDRYTDRNIFLLLSQLVARLPGAPGSPTALQTEHDDTDMGRSMTSGATPRRLLAATRRTFSASPCRTDYPADRPTTQTSPRPTCPAAPIPDWTSFNFAQRAPQPGPHAPGMIYGAPPCKAFQQGNCSSQTDHVQNATSTLALMASRSNAFSYHTLKGIVNQNLLARRNPPRSRGLGANSN